MDITSANYLNLWDILVYEVVGSLWLFIMLGLVIIAFLCAKYAVPFQVLFLLLFIYSGIVVAISGLYAVWVLVVLGVGLLFYWVLSRIMRRG
jgi:hypothetical protein